MNYYDRQPTTPEQKDHQLKINNRKLLEITGVKEVDSFDNEECLLETGMGYLIIRGENLQLKNLEETEGGVSIKGKVCELSYADDHTQEKAKRFCRKLFT